MSDSSHKEAQPLLGESNVTVTRGGACQGKTVAWVVAMVGVGVVIVLLIALPLTLVQRPVVGQGNGTANGTDVPADAPTTTVVVTDAAPVNVVTDAPADAPVDAVTQVVQAAAVDEEIAFNVKADEVRLPPELPTEVFDVCSGNDTLFRCLWVTDTGEVVDEADEVQRAGWIEVAVTAEVTNRAHQTAAEIIQRMTLNMSADLFTALAQNGKVGVQAQDQAPTIFPEYEALRDTPACANRCDAECNTTCFQDGLKFDSLSGIGKQRAVETELNVRCLADDPYLGLDNGLVHEFSHTIHKYAVPYVDGDWWNKILQAYDNALEQETWDVNSTAMSNYEEYWAKGTGVYFNTNLSDNTGGMNSCGLAISVCPCPADARAWLAQQDPALFEALAFVYGDGDSTIDAGLSVCMNNRRRNNGNCVVA